MNIHKLIWQNIKKYRKEFWFSQWQLSQDIGHKSSAYIALLEAGERNVNAVDLYKISQVLWVPIEALYPWSKFSLQEDYIMNKKKLEAIKHIISPDNQT